MSYSVVKFCAGSDFTCLWWRDGTFSFCRDVLIGVNASLTMEKVYKCFQSTQCRCTSVGSEVIAFLRIAWQCSLKVKLTSAQILRRIWRIVETGKRRYIDVLQFTTKAVVQIRLSKTREVGVSWTLVLFSGVDFFVICITAERKRWETEGLTGCMWSRWIRGIWLCGWWHTGIEGRNGCIAWL